MTDHGASGHSNVPRGAASGGQPSGQTSGQPVVEKNDAAAAHAVAHEPEHGTPGTAHAGHDPTDVALGPIDWPAWIAGALGVAAGALVLAAFYLAGRG